MPKNRNKKRNTRKVRKRLVIHCEGEQTEYNYFKKLIQSLNLRGRPISIKVVHTEKNTARELVEEAVKAREIPKDAAWVVFDKNGYTMHAEAFNKAKSKNIKIAFSSISFEFWVLIHFKYTTRAFHKASALIKYLEKSFGYNKSDKDIFKKLQDKTEIAAKHARNVRTYQLETNPDTKVYESNPYTNVDELIESIHKIIKEYE